VWCARGRDSRKKKTQLLGKYIITRCIYFPFRSLSLSFIYIRRPHIVRTLLLKTTAFAGVRGADEKESSLPRQSVRGRGWHRGATETVAAGKKRERESGSRYESRARNVSGCQVLMMINELGSGAAGCGAREIRPVYISTAFIFFLALNSLYIETDYVRELRSTPRSASAVPRLSVPLNACTKLP